MLRARLAPLLVVLGLFTSGRARADEPRAVVFVLPPIPALDAPVRDALSAHLSGLPVEPVFESFSTWPAPLRSEVSEAGSLAAAHQAFAVFWLDADLESGKDWLIYVAEPQASQVLVRRIPVEKGSENASIEAAAVIIRESAEALLAGAKIGIQAPPEPAEDAPPPPRKPTDEATPADARTPPRPVTEPRRHGFGITLGYYGDGFAEQAPWQSGFRIGALYRFKNGFHAGVGYVRYNDIAISIPGLAFDVARIPLDAELGYSLKFRRFIAGIEARSVVEVISRHVLAAAAPLAATADSTRAVLLLSPRLRLEYTLAVAVSVYLAVGADFAANQFSFISRADGQVFTELRPRPIRAAAEIGVAFWP